MTKREMAEAMLAGKTLVAKDLIYTAKWTDEHGFTFVYGDGTSETMKRGWDMDWTIQPEPRYMTRDEVLGFLANTPGIVVRYRHGNWVPKGYLPLSGPEVSKGDYEYATVDLDGNIGTPQEFRR